MKRKVYLVLMVLILMPVVFAYDINVLVKSFPGAEVRFTVLDPETGKILDSINGIFNDYSDSSGEFEISYDSAIEIVKGSIFVKVNGENVKFGESSLFIYDDYKTGGVSVVNLVNPNAPLVEFVSDKGEIDSESEEVAEEEGVVEEGAVKDEEVEEEVAEAAGITGEAVGDSKRLSSRVISLVVIGLIVVLVLFFVVRHARDKFSFGKFKGGRTASDREILDAESKLDSARKEIDDIKSRKKKLREAKDRFKKDREELGKLEKEE